MKSVIPNSELLARLSDENNFEKTKIKLLAEKIKKLKNENTTLRENILTHLKVIENLPGNSDRNTTNTLIIDNTKQKMTYIITIILIGRSLILLKIATKDRGSKNIHFETSNKFAPWLTENTDDVTKCSLQI